MSWVPLILCWLNEVGAGDPWNISRDNPDASSDRIAVEDP